MPVYAAADDDKAVLASTQAPSRMPFVAQPHGRCARCRPSRWQAFFMLRVQRRDAGGGCPPSSRGARLDVRRLAGCVALRPRRERAADKCIRHGQARHHSAHRRAESYTLAVNAHIDELSVDGRPRPAALPPDRGRTDVTAEDSIKLAHDQWAAQSARSSCSTTRSCAPFRRGEDFATHEFLSSCAKDVLEFGKHA
jgi:hypothetical protein